MTKKQIVTFMENLVHKRFTKEELENKLSIFFNEEINLAEHNVECDVDKHFIFDCTKGDFDIWYLSTQKELLYITEVACDVIHTDKGLKTLVNKQLELNENMEQELCRVVANAGGLIRTDNNKDKTTIYGFTMDDYYGNNVEKKILAVTNFIGIEENENLGILLGHIDETLEGMTDEEILELDEWETIFGGEILQNATLYNLCESIYEYIK